MHNLFSTLLVTAFVLTSVESVAQSSNIKASIELPPNFQYPNGIARTSKGTLYVGSVTSGQILRIDSQASKIFFPGSSEIFAATSLRLDEQRGILWGTSPDFLGTKNSKGEIIRRPHRIFAIDTRTGKVLRVIQMPDNGFGNDIALDNNGGVYLTDSSRPRIYYLAPGASQLQVWAENPLFNSKQIGLAGIARRQDGVIIVSMFSSGELFKVTPQAQGVAVEKISLTRKLENPDGMQFAQTGKLLVTEGSVTSGNGRLLSIDVVSPKNTPRLVETIGENMESPVNLTVAGNDVWVTESRIRHRLLPGKEKNVPSRFFIRRFNLRK
ncbi:SMP-30/Gluconolaconase/LRE domain protein [Calothrix sp. NIES-4071]|nr:SMP-30/Gluconolaconase/LRE domain protein [Calothrix sp. NIES-4071]BAZ58842.1 SMP-30/Gluconolaconase/LRE domain protein [Calothrix sp. NIES-4105]